MPLGKKGKKAFKSLEQIPPRNFKGTLPARTAGAKKKRCEGGDRKTAEWRKVCKIQKKSSATQNISKHHPEGNKSLPKEKGG